MVPYPTVTEEEMSYVKTSISLEKNQADFLKSSGYSISKLVRLQISNLIKESEGQSLREQQPTDEPSEDSNNG